MARVTDRLRARVLRDFGPGADADAVLTRLETIPEAISAAELQDPERLQAACVLPARGDREKFRRIVDLATVDWRDALLAADLAEDDWAVNLDAELGPPA